MNLLLGLSHCRKKDKKAFEKKQKDIQKEFDINKYQQELIDEEKQNVKDVHVAENNVKKTFIWLSY